MSRDSDQALDSGGISMTTGILATESMATEPVSLVTQAVSMATPDTTDVMVSGLEDGKVKILSGGMLVSAEDLAGGGDHTVLTTALLGQGLLVEGQAGYDHGVILVGQADGQLVGADPGQLASEGDHATLTATGDLLLGADHGGLTLDPPDLQGDPQAPDGELLLTGEGEGARLVSLHPGGLPQALTHGLPAGLQNLVLTTPSGETVQVIALQSLFPDAGAIRTAKVADDDNKGGALDGEQQDSSVKSEDDDAPSLVAGGDAGGSQTVDFGGSGLRIGSLGGLFVSEPVIEKVLPPGTPQWATRLNDCERIGDSYRGWVENEMDLDLLLTFHKQQTHSFWGTRQSPSPAKPSTRLMWKSQYVPFDGIPFINAGSRAIVLECQHGPRRKTAASKRQNDLPKGAHKQACPARIYIKKVKKYPGFAVEMTTDKKSLKGAMDKAFMAIKEMGAKAQGQDRYYVQLPTQDGHEFHGNTIVEAPHRLEPRVADKIRDLVSQGETRLYAIRKALRRFVEKELFPLGEPVPEKHNLTYYPTVNDLQNHIHQAIRDIEVGMLPVNASTVKVEMIAGDSSSNEEPGDGLSLWTQIPGSGQPQTESVTVTLTQRPGQDGEHVISKVETHMSDGTTQVSTNLTPETAALLSKLHPNIFTGAGGMAPAADAPHMDQLHASLLPAPQAQYVVMEEGIPKDGIPHEGLPRVEADTEVMLAADPSVSVVEIDPEMGLGGDGEDELSVTMDTERDGLSVSMDTEREGLSVSMDADHAQLESNMKLVSAKLESDADELVNYGHVVSMATEEMPVSGGLEETMETSDHSLLIV